MLKATPHRTVRGSGSDIGIGPPALATNDNTTAMLHDAMSGTDFFKLARMHRYNPGPFRYDRSLRRCVLLTATVANYLASILH